MSHVVHPHQHPAIPKSILESEARLLCTKIATEFFLNCVRRFVILVKRKSILAAGITPAVGRLHRRKIRWSSGALTSSPERLKKKTPKS